MYRICRILIIICMLMIGCQHSSRCTEDAPLPAEFPLLQKTSNVLAPDDALDIVRKLEDSGERSKLIDELRWVREWRIEENASTMTILSIIERRGHIDEVPPKLRADYYLCKLCPFKKRSIRGWKDWSSHGLAHGDWWTPFVTREGEKTIFRTYHVGSDRCETTGDLCGMGREAIPSVLEYIAEQETEGGRILALFCFHGIVGRRFDISEFFDTSDWQAAASQLKEWWQKAKDWTKEQIAREALADSNILVRISGAKTLISYGEKDGIRGLLDILKEMTAGYENYADDPDDRYWKRGIIDDVVDNLLKNLGNPPSKYDCSTEKGCKKAFKTCTKLFEDCFDKVAFDEKEEIFKLQADK